MPRVVFVSGSEAERLLRSCMAEAAARRVHPTLPVRRTFDEYADILVMMCEAWWPEVDLPTALELSRLPSAPPCFRVLHELAEAANLQPPGPWGQYQCSAPSA